MPQQAYKQAYSQSVSITRPANTTGYTGGDVVGVADSVTPANAGSAIHTFGGVGSRGGLVVITDVSLEQDASSIPSGETTHTLHLYDTSPTAILDNAAWDLPSGDRAYYLGSITIAQIVDLGSTLYIEATGVNKTVKLADGSNSLYAELVTVGAYTPTSACVYKLTIKTRDA